MTQVKQQDVAKALGVSRITVSKALRNHPDISPEMKAKVKHVAEELGYFPNWVARNLSSRKTNTIGVVVPDVANPFFSNAIHGIIDVATEKGYQTILTVSRERSDIETKNIKTLLAMRVDGLLVCISQNTTDYQIFEAVKKMKVPLVFFDRTIQGSSFSSVTVDDRDSAFRAVEYGIKMGYTKIGHLAGYSFISIGKDRMEGYLGALKKYGLVIRPEWIIEGGFEKESGYRNCNKLLNYENVPELIFTVNAPVAQGAYEAVEEKGLRIPQDIAFIGFGHREISNMLRPRLTVMRQNPEDIGRKAMEILGREMECLDTKHQQRVILPMELEIHESCMSITSNNGAYSPI